MFLIFLITKPDVTHKTLSQQQSLTIQETQVIRNKQKNSVETEHISYNVAFGNNNFKGRMIKVNYHQDLLTF